MMGYQVYHACRLEDFLDHWDQYFFQKDPLDSPLYIVVQNASLGEWLKHALVQRSGVLMGGNFLMPEMGLRLFAEAYPSTRFFLEKKEGKKNILTQEGMKLSVLKALEEAVNSADPVYACLQSYVGKGRVRQGRIWQLAQALAGIFFHYSKHCFPLIDAWENKKTYPGCRTEAATEQWQSSLWRRIFHPQAPYTHLNHLLAELMRRKEHYEGRAARVLLFGFLSLGEMGQRFFHHLSQDLEVHHFLPTLSQSYGAQGLVQQEKPENLSFLRSTGSFIRGYTTLNSQLESRRVEKKWKNYGDKNSLLYRVRAALITDRELLGPVEDDGSLAFHNVSNPRREVEILKDRLLAALRDNPHLLPSQIAVLAPDINLYAPYIEAIFPALNKDGQSAAGHLPYHFVDRSSRQEAPYPTAFRALLALPGSRFGRQTLLNLMVNPCFSSGDSLSKQNIEDWKRISKALHVRWGTDASHRQESGVIDTNSGSWEMAFSRLLAGFYHDEEDNLELLPAHPEGDNDADQMGQLMRIVRSLDADLRQLSEKKYSLRHWILLWEIIAETWLIPRSLESEAAGDEDDRLEIKQCFRSLLDAYDNSGELSDFTDSMISWVAFRSLMEECLENNGKSGGRYFPRGIHCGTLKALCPLPFRHIYLLGLNEDRWPGQETLAGFDLRAAVSQERDFSRNKMDRSAFLDSIFSAREHLSLFYSGRDAQRGTKQAPAVPVLEFFGLLGPHHGKLIREHPLNPYDQKAFSGEGALASSSAEALALARSQQKRSPSKIFLAKPLFAEQHEEDVSWERLLAFLKNPIRQFYRDRLGLPPIKEEKNEGEEDVLEAGVLDWWVWRNQHTSEAPDVLRKPREFVQTFLRKLQNEAVFSNSLMADFQAEKYQEEAQKIAENIEALQEEGLSLGEPFSYRLVSHGTREDRTAPSPGARLLLQAPQFSLGEGKSISINGLIPGWRFLAKNKEIWTLLDFVSGPKVTAKNWLKSWLMAVVIGSVLGKDGPQEIRVFPLGSHEHKVKRYSLRSSFSSLSGNDEKAKTFCPADTLKKIVKIYIDGQRLALPLYPELGEALAQEEKKEALGEQLPVLAQALWEKFLGNSFTLSEIRGCPYRQRYLPSPDFRSPSFRFAYETLYRDGGFL